MSTKKISKKSESKKVSAKKASVKKVADKKVSAKQAEKKAKGGKAESKKAASKKTATAKAEVKGSVPVFHLYDEAGKTFEPVAKAQEVAVKGFEKFQFFLHRNPDDRAWTLSEATSGARISVGRTRKEARDKAAEALAKHGAADLAESIKNAIAKNGVAPGFAELPPESSKQTPSVTSKTDQPQVTTRLKSKILAALVDEQMLAKPHVHFDEIAKATGAPVSDVGAALMILELDRKVTSLPGKFYKLPEGKDGEPSGNRGRKPNGKKSQLDVAVEILTEAKEPLTCKEISRRMLERKLWETNGRTPGATLSASIQREISKRGAAARFRKASRGLFELNA